MAIAQSKTNTVTIGTMSKQEALKWLVIFLISGSMFLIPVTDNFTSDIRLFFAITLFAILLFAFELIGTFIPALILPVVYILAGLATPDLAFKSWSNSMPWLYLGGLLFASALERTGLLTRVAYWCIIRTGGSYKGILYGITLAGALLGIFLPGLTIVPFAILCYGICNALGLKRSKTAGGIMLVGLMAVNLPIISFFNPVHLMVAQIGADAAPIQPAYMEIMLYSWPMLLFSLLSVFMLTRVMKEDEKVPGKQFFVDEYMKLGKASMAEKKSILLCILLLLFMLTGSIHKVDIAWGFLLIGVMCFLPGLRLGDESCIKSLNFPLIVFIATCMTIGNVSSSLGVGTLLANIMSPIMGGGNLLIAIFFIWLIAVLSNFVLTPFAAIAAFTLPIMQISVEIGLNPYIALLVFIYGLHEIAMPYETAQSLLFFSFGMIHLKDFAKVLSARMVLNIIFIMAVMVPYWHLVGLL